MVLSSFDSDRLSNIVKADYGLVLYLATPPEQASTITAADIYLYYLEGHGVANLWVGDLHIGYADKGKSRSTRRYCPYFNKMGNQSKICLG